MPTSDSQTPGDPSVDLFLRHYASHQTRLRAYILSLIGNWDDAEDILQETTTVLWSKFSEFAPGSNFFAWACQVARYEVAKHRRTQQRSQEVFSDQFADLVADTAVEMTAELTGRQRALSTCVDELSPADRELLRLRYVEGATGEEVASEVDRSVHAVYKSYKRIRHTLYDCVQSHVREEEDG